MATSLREGIWVGTNDDAHKILEVVTASINIDFGAMGLSSTALVSASASMPGAKLNMLFFTQPMAGYAANSAGFSIVGATCLTADTVTFTAANVLTANIDPGTATFAVLGVRTS